jgi:hypothetical protein
MTDNIAGETLADLSFMSDGICPACRKPLPIPRDRMYTCSDLCHGVWIDIQVARWGPTRTLTDMATGKRHLVPTREILEIGIKAENLHTYPEAEG